MIPCIVALNVIGSSDDLLWLILTCGLEMTVTLRVCCNLPLFITADLAQYPDVCLPSNVFWLKLEYVEIESIKTTSIGKC